MDMNLLIHSVFFSPKNNEKAASLDGFIEKI